MAMAPTLRHPLLGGTSAPTNYCAALTDRNLLAVNRAGLVNNLNGGLAWGLLPILFAADGLSVTGRYAIGALVAGITADLIGIRGAVTVTPGR
jgi:hypothetical protein